MTGLGVLWHSLTPNLCRKTRSAVARSNARAVGSAPTSKRPARRRPDGNIFKFGARFGRKRCAASAQRPLCISDRCRLLCALSAHCLPC